MESKKEVTFERTYNAPISVIWKAWTDPETLKQWWGPDNVFTPECSIDLKVGGEVYIVMEAGEGLGEYKGTRWPMRGNYEIIEPNSRIVYRAKAWVEGDEVETQIDQITDVKFEDQDGKTKITLKATVLDIGPKAGMAIQGMEYGFNQQLDKLAKML